MVDFSSSALPITLNVTSTCAICTGVITITETIAIWPIAIERIANSAIGLWKMCESAALKFLLPGDFARLSIEAYHMPLELLHVARFIFFQCIAAVAGHIHAVADRDGTRRAGAG